MQDFVHQQNHGQVGGSVLSVGISEIITISVGIVTF